MLAVAVFAYQRTGSPLIVAVLTMLRMLPMALFGAVVGAMAERLERRTALIIVVISMLLTSLVLACLAWSDTLEVWQVALASFVNGIAWTTDNPVRRTMIGEVVGPDRMSAAMSLDVGANNASRMLGPTLGGVLLATFGIGGAFAVSVACYLVALAAAMRIHHRNSVRPAGVASVLERMLEGFMLVRRDRRLIGTLVVTVIYNIFGWPFTSMIPVIGQDNLGLGAAGIGLLASMDGVGAFCGAVAIALFAQAGDVRPRLSRGRLRLPAAGAGFRVGARSAARRHGAAADGIANAGFSIMQATLVYLAAPPEMRSRIYGVLSVCIGVGMIGFIHLGLLAGLVGASWATAMIGAEGIAAMLLTRRWWRAIAA